MISQGMLLDAGVCAQREVTWDAVKASFTEREDASYDVLLEVSSNKFWVTMTRDEFGIASFEIISSKGFLELTTKLISLIKRLVNHLREMVD
ncbi:MAG: hypothetical protein PHU61_03720 [Candidatus Absconditabacteria bacterium]|nr:hypothetical protein [Candidatus Absconditabacteria bacterium]MDD3868357.1 hypothetical protein [Candidatus Absconditabacteria bacterium]MDD4714438.1 hypothetical protein [Candidatus Absconditabacteria bacterium]